MAVGTDGDQPGSSDGRSGGLTGLIEDFTDSTRATRAAYREIAVVLSGVRAPLVVAILGFVAYAFPGQTLEIYRLYAENFDLANGFTSDNWRFLIFFITLYITGYVLWYIARLLTVALPHIRPTLGEHDADGFVARWAPRVIGALPSFGAALGMFRAEYFRSGDASTPALYGAAAVALLIGLIRLWSSWRRLRGRGDVEVRYAAMTGTWLRSSVRIPLSLLLLAGVAYLMTQPVDFSQFVGILSIFGFFMITLAFGWAHLSYLNDRYAMPLLLILVVSALTYSWLDLNDNHFVRTIDEAAERPDPNDVASIDSAFTAWLDTRADRQAYIDAGKPYPVYVIAAQGGGLYAAYQAGMFLAKIQDECPTFAQHVFVISGVSGGSVGAAIFTGMAKRYADNQPIASLDAPCGVARPGAPSFVELTDRVLRQDFLSPLMTALLFSDFTARFSPVAIPAFSRARALERAFETAWTRAATAFGVEGETEGADIFQYGLMSYWRPDGAAPLLMMNTTEVESGDRVVLTPISDMTPGVRSYARDAAIGVDPAPDMRFSTAMVLSARFPYVTPAGSLNFNATGVQGDTDELSRKARLVDGGYFENSGIETAAIVVRALQRAERRAIREAERQEISERVARGESFEEVTLAIEEQRRRRRERNDPTLYDVRLVVFDLTDETLLDPNYGLNEELSPVKAILNARISRAELAQTQTRLFNGSACRYLIPGAQINADTAFDEADGGAERCPASSIQRSTVWSVSLNDDDYEFELGWILSDETLARIDQQLGAAGECYLNESPPPTAGLSPISSANAPPPVFSDAGYSSSGDGASGSGDLTDDFAPDAARRADEVETATAEDRISRHNSCIAHFLLEQLMRTGDERAPLGQWRVR